MDDVVKKPLQQRSRDSLEQLMNAGIEIMMQGGEAEFSVAALSMKSGVSVGSIYQRFGSKEMIYLALQDRILTRMDDEAETLFERAPHRQIERRAVMANAVERFCGHVRKYEPLLRSLIRLDAHNARAGDRGRRSCEKIGAIFVNYLKAELGPPSALGLPQKVYDDCFAVVFSCAWHRIIDSPMQFGMAALTWDDVVRILTDMCAGYLTPDRHTPSS